MGWGEVEGWSLHPAPHGFILPHPCLAPPRMTKKTFSPHPYPVGPREALPLPIKLYFLLICPTISTNFLIKPISLIKIYLKLQLNLSHQIKSIFRKKKILNNISKCLTRQSPKEKNPHSIIHNKIKVENYIK